MDVARIPAAAMLAVLFFCWTGTGFAEIQPSALPGVVVDHSAAELQGDWQSSTHSRPFVGGGYAHDQNEAKGEKHAKFTVAVPEDGSYRFLFAYSAESNRATNVPIILKSAGEDRQFTLNQRKAPGPLAPFHMLVELELKGGTEVVAEVSTRGTDGHVIIDAVALVPVAGKDAFAKAIQSIVKTPPPKVANVKKPKPEKKVIRARLFSRQAPQQELASLTSDQLDALIDESLAGAAATERISDEAFARRVALDLIGRPLNADEMGQFREDNREDKRAQLIEQLLASEDFGANWANYWSDTIAHRVQPPELTFLSYVTFKRWMAEKLNHDAGWDQIVYEILTANGKVADNPAATFVGFHQASPISLTNETARVFLGVQINCAQCHNHPFASWEQEQFHQLAAYFARTKAKLPWNDSNAIEVSDSGKGEYKMPKQGDNKGGVMTPGFLSGETLELGRGDLERREALAQLVVDPENQWFARSYVNRVWSRLMGRGFVEPVDDLAEDATVLAPKVFNSLADTLVANEFQGKTVFRVILNSQAYQRQLSMDSEMAPFGSAVTAKLRGDEVFDSLRVAVGLPNKVGEQAKASSAERFPPPPKSTRDLVNEAFGYDPSIPATEIVRTMKQAMLLMNNDQIHDQIDADPESKTLLSQLLLSEEDDSAVVQRLYEAVLARRPTEPELTICLEHIRTVGQRGDAFEDVLWSLINTAEFTTRR